MSSLQLFTNITQLAFHRGEGALRGDATRDLCLFKDAAFAVTEGVISWVGRRRDFPGQAGAEIDLQGGAVVPALVDPHTHAIWGGDRLNDFEARVSGVPYEEILAGGGGIRSTVRQTSGCTSEELVQLARPRIAALMASGATTIEVKSGYGFSVDAELTSLDAIRQLGEMSAARIIPTLLIHIPPRAAEERERYLDAVVAQLIPEVARRRLARTVDIFIEREAFGIADARRVFDAAQAHGLAVKAHVDQFHAIGGLELAVAYGARSVDHLEASGPDQIRALAGSDTVGVILPGVTLHLGLPAAPGRALLDAGAIVAVGTDLNPGSSPLFSAQMALALAVRLNGLTPAEALAAATVNAAAALGLADCGRLSVGQRADFLLLHGTDWRDIAYQMGTSPIHSLFIAGHEMLS